MAVCIGLLVFVAKNTDWKIVRQVVANLNYSQALLAIVIFIPAPTLQSLRLVWMLRIQNIRISYWLAMKFSFAGNLLNFAIPGSTGGDLYKAYYLTKHTHQKTAAVTTIFLDRIVGLTSLILFVGTITLVRYSDPLIGQIRVISSVPLKLAPAAALSLAMLAIGAFFYFSPTLRRALRISRIIDRLPMAGVLRQADTAIRRVRGGIGWLVACFVISFILQLSAIVSAYVGAQALGMSDHFMPYLVYVSLGFLVWSVPISFGGLGTMDVFYQKVFTETNLGTDEQAFCLAWFVRLTQLLWSLPGVLVPLTGAHLPSADAIAELETEEQASPNNRLDET